MPSIEPDPQRDSAAEKDWSEATRSIGSISEGLRENPESTFDAVRWYLVDILSYAERIDVRTLSAERSEALEQHRKILEEARGHADVGQDVQAALLLALSALDSIDETIQAVGNNETARSESDLYHAFVETNTGILRDLHVLLDQKTKG